MNGKFDGPGVIITENKGILISYFRAGQRWGQAILDIYLCDVCEESKPGPYLTCQDVMYCAECNENYFETKIKELKVPLTCVGSFKDEKSRTKCG